MSYLTELIDVRMLPDESYIHVRRTVTAWKTHTLQVARTTADR